MKKILSLFLALLMILSCVPISASVFAEATEPTSAPIIKISETYGKLGKNVNVGVKVSGNPGIAGAKLTFSFPDELKLVSAANGKLFDDTDFTMPNNFKSPCSFTWERIDGVTAENGTLLTLTFEIPSDAECYDKFNVSATYKKGDFFNELDGEAGNVSFVISNGSVEALDFLPGDVNDDGVVNGKDIRLIRQFNSTGYDVTINERAGDVNDDGVVNGKDVRKIRRYFAGGYDELLYPSHEKCRHDAMTAVAAKAATCTENGNIAYWHCASCDKYFSDADAGTEITLDETVIKANGHTVVIDPAVPADYEHKGLTEGSHCSVCGEVLVPQNEYGPLERDTANITYKIAYKETTTNNGTKTIVADSYIAEQTIENTNPNVYTPGKELKLKELALPGYDFLGWFTSPETGAKRVYNITADDNGDKVLYAVWSEKTFNVTYKLYKTPLENTIDSKYCSFTVSKGLADLPNPTINNYIFLGWYDENKNEVNEIPVGTAHDVVLNAYWTSKRNLAKAKTRLDDPVIVEDNDAGVIYFAYELGTIENIPLSDNIWTIQSVSGLSQQKSETYTTSLSQTKADSIAKTISNSTVDSNTWTLSEGWSDSTSVTKEWASEHGMTVEEANEKCKSVTGTFSTTNSNGGNKATTGTDGTTTVNYNSENKTLGDSAELSVGFNSKFSNSTEISAGMELKGKVPGIGGGSVSAGLKNTSTFEVGSSVEGSYKHQTETNTHTGTDTTNVNTTVTNEGSTWNSSSSASQTNSASQTESVKKAISEIVSEKKGYGSTYAKNGQDSKTQGFSATKSDSLNSSSTFTWATTETKTVTNTYSTDGKSEGCYRLVIAGTAHVFGVVGYDVASRSYFAYTYSIMDDNQYEFLDYSTDLNFSDSENSVIPFEMPYYVHEYVTESTAKTDGLTFRTNTSTKTATVSKYDGSDTDVTVPNYISSGGVAYRVTGIEASAFAGQNVRAVILSKYIKEIPAGAFKDCKQLEQVSGYFDVIGEEAFSGCTAIKSFIVPTAVNEIGEDAFYGVQSVTVCAISQEASLAKAKTLLKNEGIEPIADGVDPESEAAKAYNQKLNDKAAAVTQQYFDSLATIGTDNLTVELSAVHDAPGYSITVPKISEFDLYGNATGNKKVFSDLKIVSDAKKTEINRIAIKDCTRVPLEISSSELVLMATSVESNGFALLLSKQNANVKLILDNVLSSANGKAIVAYAPNISSEVVDGAMGVLDVNGNFYVCGTAKGMENVNVTGGSVISVTKKEFDNLIKGCYTVTFNSNGGSLSDASKTVVYGDCYGVLPVPVRKDCTFLGWYLSDGTRVYEDTVFDESDDVTLRAYWQSGWVAASEAPAGGEIKDTKWTYDLATRISSKNPTAPDGYTSYKNPTWEWGSYGSWSGWTNSAVSGSDSRQVETKRIEATGYTEWNYSQWCQNANGTGKNGPWQGTWGGVWCGNYRERGWSTDRLSVWSTQSSGGTQFSLYGTSTNTWYNENSRWVETSPAYTQYRYRDRSKIYTYYYQKLEAKESATEIGVSDTVSNVQKWVQYVIK